MLIGQTGGMNKTKPTYHGYCFPPEIISHAPFFSECDNWRLGWIVFSAHQKMPGSCPKETLKAITIGSKELVDN
jgi:hypothetical protein